MPSVLFTAFSVQRPVSSVQSSPVSSQIQRTWRTKQAKNNMGGKEEVGRGGERWVAQALGLCNDDKKLPSKVVDKTGVGYKEGICDNSTLRGVMQ